MKKILLITGGSRGIGAATARLAAQRDYDAIAINYHSRSDAAEDLVKELQHQGVQAIAIQADVAKESEVVAMFQRIDNELGPVTALVNNAGILDQQTTFEQMSVERWQSIFNTNVIGSFVCAREAIKRMSTHHGGQGGAIVNLSSIAARLGAPGEYVDYAASKGAIDTFTIGLAKEVGDQGIRVNAVRPGIIKTDIHASGGEAGRVDRIKDSLPMKRGGDPEEVASAILWLLSDEASYTTGTFIDISGGRL
ncbi:MAG: SDR family oxidoreductase [Motiliproteus sp.]|nr:SDR family oxidoreductase [Motiliproteus sp.]MCW9052939.1 SDR family oxidoreductase [Motiliproteus sp.]